MGLIPGTRLGVYEVIAQIGAGGMGEVYRARDTKLNRDVALKILPDAFSADLERLGRFEREAQVLASLNHPHIGSIYGFEDASGIRALVLELVEGPTLAEKIGTGLPVVEALNIAREICEALEAAHAKGVIHRDLKPANVKITLDGKVKVLDFGLAKAMEASPAYAQLTQSPTLSLAATFAGVILGTAAYMSPEQAKGFAADERSDVFAFGCVLYEMLTGRQPFEGDTVSEVLASVLKSEPDESLLPRDLNPRVRALVHRCLEKNPRRRFYAIGDVRVEIEEILADPTRGVDQTRQPAPSRPLWKRAVFFAVTALVAGAIVGAAVWMIKPTPPAPPAPVTRFAIPLVAGQTFNPNSQALALSPDGTRLVYAADNQLYLRSLSDLEARPIPGMSQPSTSPAVPVFSPNGRSVAFFSNTELLIKKIAVSGGVAVTICHAESPFRGMSWDGGELVFAQAGKGILRVSENGGQPSLIASVKDDELPTSPQMLPGGEWVLFSIATVQTGDAWDKAQVVVQSLKTSERKTLITGGDARYVSSGHILYALGGVLFAVPFDLQRLEITGGPVSVVEGVKRSLGGSHATAQLSISNTGSLAFIPGPVTMSAGQSDLAVIDRAGTVQPLKLPPNAYEYPRRSPDGKHIAVGSDDGKEAIVWIYDVSGATSIRRLTLGGRNRLPIWADAERVAFQSDREGDLAIWWQRADGSTPAERLTKPDKDTAHVPESWSPDGKTLLLSVAKGTHYSVAALSLTDKKITPIDRTQSDQPPGATFSPDGRWVAYSVAAPGTNVGAGSLFVQPFPTTGSTYPISKGTGFHPLWSSDGKELFSVPAPGQYVSVSVTTRPTLNWGNPERISSPGEGAPTLERRSDIAPDGKQFIGVVAAAQTTSASGAAAAPQIQVVLNWFEELRQRVPATK